MFESREERNKAAEQFAAERGDPLRLLIEDKEFEMGNDVGSLRTASTRGDSGPLLKQIFEAIDKESAGTPDSREALKDAIYQVYLQTMPEQSFRKQFIHRKGRTGFSTDLQRNLATTATKQAIQLARIKYAPLLRNSIAAAKESIAEQEELSPYVAEADRRVNELLSGGKKESIGDAIAGLANKTSFFWYLSAPSSALLQPTSVFISGLPILAANHNDAIGAARELGKMMTLVNQYTTTRKNPDGSTSLVAPSIANNTSLSAEERRAIRQMTERGVSQSTYASLVYGYKSASTEQYESFTGKGVRAANVIVGGLMHNAERLSREAVYLASYRLGRKRGLSENEAIQQAVEDTNESLGNYDVSNRPIWMQKGIGKVLNQFKMYPLQILLVMGTNFKRMIVPLNNEGRKAAATKFFGMMATSALIGGTANMALFAPIMGMLGWMWKEFSKDDDWPDELKDIDMYLWFRTVYLPEHLGQVSLAGVPLSDWVDRGPINALTGWDVGSRAGLGDIFGRDSKETKTSRDSAIAYMLDHFAGPTASLALSFADAFDAYAMGDYQKMQEKMYPAVAKNILETIKYANEGIKTSKGVELLSKDDITMGELIGRAIGFRPDIIGVTQDLAFKMSGIDQRINNERTQIMDMLKFESRKDTDEGSNRFDKLIEDKVSKFNNEYPSYRITGSEIVNSLVKDSKAIGNAPAGVVLNKQNTELLGEAADKLQDRLDKRRMRNK